MEALQFEWDEKKNLINVEKHAIAFESALKIFSGEVFYERSDRYREERHKAIGLLEDKIIAVIFTRRPHAIRIISARKARKKEKIAYSTLFGGQSARRH